MQEQTLKPARGKKAITQKLAHIAAVMRLLGIHEVSTHSDYEAPMHFDAIQCSDQQGNPVVGMEIELERVALKMLKKFGIPELESKSDRKEEDGCSISFKFDDNYILSGTVEYYYENETDDSFEGTLTELIEKKESYDSLKTLLLQHGVKRITGEFSGGNDSGGFDTFELLDATGAALSLESSIHNKIQGMIEDPVWDKMEVYSFNGDFSVSGEVNFSYDEQKDDYDVVLSKSESCDESTHDSFDLPKYC